MNKGKVVQIGRPLDVYRNPADTFVAKFLGNPPMNLLQGRLDTQDGRPVARIAGNVVALPRRTAAALGRHVGRDVIIGVRPEDIYETAPSGDASEIARLPRASSPSSRWAPKPCWCWRSDASNEELIARIGRDTALRSGDRLEIALDTAPSICSIPSPRSHRVGASWEIVNLTSNDECCSRAYPIQHDLVSAASDTQTK